jgi:hypothetical protein
MSAPDPLTAPLPWCIAALAVLEPLPPDIAALFGQADIAAEYVELARERIAAAQLQAPLFAHEPTPQPARQDALFTAE